MGKWTKAHFDTSKGLNPKAKFEGITDGLKDDMSPDMPGETAEEKALRNRQAMEISKIDSEENRRIKSMFAGGGARKLFRGARSSGNKAAGSAGSRASATATKASGSFRAPSGSVLP